MKRYARLKSVDGSIAVILPKDIERAVGISINSPVSVEVSRNRIIVNVEISKVEMEVIKKLLSYKFEERTKEVIEEKFTPAQKKILFDLMKRKVIMAYKGGKYKEEVYSVPKKIYEILVNFGVVKRVEEKGERKKEKKEVKEEKEKKEEIEEEGKKEKKTVDILFERGYLVLESEQEANEVSDEIKKKIKEKKIVSTEFRGVKGFDKKFYIIRRSLLSKYAPKVIEILKGGEKKFDEIQREAKIDKDLLASILAMLNEDGEIIERKKKTFCLA